MKIDEIERAVAGNSMTAAQVFTQMKQHVDPIRSNERQKTIGDCIQAVKDAPHDVDDDGGWIMYSQGDIIRALKSVV